MWLLKRSPKSFRPIPRCKELESLIDSLFAGYPVKPGRAVSASLVKKFGVTRSFNGWVSSAVAFTPDYNKVPNVKA
jgi:hypothetical protein